MKVKALNKCWWTGKHNFLTKVVDHDGSKIVIGKCSSCDKVVWDVETGGLINEPKPYDTANAALLRESIRNWYVEENSFPTKEMCIEFADHHMVLIEEKQAVLNAMAQAQRIAIDETLKTAERFLMSSVMCPPSLIKEKVLRKLNLNEK